jgi:hypothetical protein
MPDAGRDGGVLSAGDRDLALECAGTPLYGPTVTAETGGRSPVAAAGYALLTASRALSKREATTPKITSPGGL